MTGRVVAENRHTLEALADTFIEFIQYEKHYSDHTIKNYSRDIDQFTLYLRQLKVVHWADVSNQQVQQFIASRHRQGLHGKSMQRQLSAIRSLFRFLVANNHVTNNPVTRISIPKSGRKLPHVIDSEVFQQLINIKDDSTIACRDIAIMELFYSSGLRLSELSQLDFDTIDLRAQLVRVTGKGSRQRDVPVGRYAIGAINTGRLSATKWQIPIAAHCSLAREGVGSQCDPFNNGSATGEKTRPRTTPPPASVTPFLCQSPARIVKRPEGRSGNARAR